MYGISSTPLRPETLSVYISARDCVPALGLIATYLERFSGDASERLRCSQVVVAHLNDIRDQDYWPSDLKPLLAQFGNKEARRAFLSLHDGRWSRNLFKGSSGRALAGIS